MENTVLSCDTKDVRLMRLCLTASVNWKASANRARTESPDCQYSIADVSPIGTADTGLATVMRHDSVRIESSAALLRGRTSAKRSSAWISATKRCDWIASATKKR